jgi:hypothetical protein
MRSRRRLSDLPMVPIGIDDSSDAPPMSIRHRPDDGSSRRNRFGERGVRVVYDHHHPDGTSGKCLGTEIPMLGRLIGYPKFSSLDRQTGYYCAVRCVDSINDFGSERGFVELDGLGSAAD